MPRNEPITHDMLDRDGSPNLSDFGWRFLAEGDSWFDLGTLNLFKNANLLKELSFVRSHITVNCAKSGDTLSKMVDWRRDPVFNRLLTGRRARHWDGILLSAGGNDLLSAIKTPATADGQPVPLDRRLLRTMDEWGSAAEGAARYASDAGWQRFAEHMRHNFDELVKLRDSGINQGQPIFMHGYAILTPRNAGVSLGPLKGGPWLLPSLVKYGIPPGPDRLAVARHFIERLRDLLKSIADNTHRYPRVHFFDSTEVTLVAADVNSEDDNGDWINEIHLNKSGCRKVSGAWSPQIEAVLH